MSQDRRLYRHLEPHSTWPWHREGSRGCSEVGKECNEYCARLRDARPERYGFFAAVPDLQKVDDVVTEIAYALDELKADGIILLTSYGESAPLYLGHEKFVPVWKALNARQAVVFVHPTHAAGSTQVSKYLPQPSFDYPHETGRTAIDLILSGMLQNHAQNCKIILSHAGGTLPYLIDRTAGMAPYMPEAMNPGLSRDQILEQARWFFYDTALSSSPMHLRALMALLGSDGKSHVIFGSDFPNAPPGGIEYFTAQLEASEDVVVTDLRKNALALFPRLR